MFPLMLTVLYKDYSPPPPLFLSLVRTVSLRGNIPSCRVCVFGVWGSGLEPFVLFEGSGLGFGGLSKP